VSFLQKNFLIKEYKPKGALIRGENDNILIQFQKRPGANSKKTYGDQPYKRYYNLPNHHFTLKLAMSVGSCVGPSLHPSIQLVFYECTSPAHILDEPISPLSLTTRHVFSLVKALLNSTKLENCHCRVRG